MNDSEGGGMNEWTRIYLLRTQGLPVHEIAERLGLDLIWVTERMAIHERHETARKALNPGLEPPRRKAGRPAHEVCPHCGSPGLQRRKRG